MNTCIDISLCLLELKSRLRDIWYNILTRGRHDRCFTCLKKINPDNPGRTFGPIFAKFYAFHDSCLKRNLELHPEEVSLLEKILSKDYRAQEAEADQLGISRQQYIRRIERMVERKTLMPDLDEKEQE